MAITDTNVADRMAAGSAATTTNFKLAWSSVWSGFLISVGAFLLLTVLGLAIGISAADIGPGENGNAGELGLGAAIWSGITLLIALFLGGMAATRTGIVYDKAVGVTEGVLIWVLAMLALIYMAGSGIGMLSSGVFGALGGVAKEATSAMSNVNVADLTSGDPSRIAARMRDPATVRGVAVATGVPEQEARASLNAIAQRVEAARDDPAEAAAAARAGAQELAAKASARMERAAADAQPYAATTLWSTLAAMVVALLAAIAGAMTGRSQATRRLHSGSPELATVGGVR